MELSRYSSKDWHSDLILSNFGILALSFQTLKYVSYTSKLWNSGLILPNIKNTLPNFWILAFSFKTFEDWSCTSKLWNSGLYPSKHCIYYLTLPNIGIHIPFQNIGTPLVLLLSNIWIFILSFETLLFLSYPPEHWNSRPILIIIRNLILSFQTLEFFSYPFKHWNSDCILLNIWILILSFESLEFLSYSSNSGVLILSFKALEFLSYLSKHWNSYKCLQICGANFPHLQPMAKFRRDQRGEIGRQHVKAHSCSHFSPCFDWWRHKSLLLLLLPLPLPLLLSHLKFCKVYYMYVCNPDLDCWRVKMTTSCTGPLVTNVTLVLKIGS